MSIVFEMVILVVLSLSLYDRYKLGARIEKLDAHAGDAFGAVGGDMGNHEFRIENIEQHLGLKTVSSPSVQSIKDELSNEEEVSSNVSH